MEQPTKHKYFGNTWASSIKRCVKKLATHAHTSSNMDRKHGASCKFVSPMANLLEPFLFSIHGKIRWQASTDTIRFICAVYGQLMLQKEKKRVPPNNPTRRKQQQKKNKTQGALKAPSWARKSHNPFCWIDNMWQFKGKSYVCLFSPLSP